MPLACSLPKLQLHVFFQAFFLDGWGGGGGGGVILGGNWFGFAFVCVCVCVRRGV